MLVNELVYGFYTTLVKRFAQDFNADPLVFCFYRSFGETLLLFTFVYISHGPCSCPTFPANIRLDEDKTSLVFVFRRPLHQDQHIGLGHMSSRRVQDVLKTSSRRFQDVLKTSSRHLQDVFKTHYQVKLFLVTELQDVFETYSKPFWDVLLRWLSTRGLPRSHFWEIYGRCRNFSRVIKISQVLIFHFTTPFTDYTLQRCTLNMVEHLQWSFFSENT